jgi:REP element-mobilizing transposase RayT
MPRTPRCFEPGSVYHLISRFVDREWFIRTSKEREHYLKLLCAALTESDWRLLAYAVMSNHIHLAMVAGTDALDSWLRRAHTPFADMMNNSYDRIGPMFARGPKDHVMSAPDVGNLIAYIHNNPVRAGVCAIASDTDWTSHRAYVGAAPVPGSLHVTEGLAYVGVGGAEAFDAWVNDPTRANSEHSFTEEGYEEGLRESRAAIAVPVRISLAPETIVATTASVLGISVAQLTSSSRGAIEVAGRAVAVHVARRAGLTEVAIAAALRVSQQRVSTLRRQTPTEEVAAACSRVALQLGFADGHVGQVVEVVH